MSVKYKINREMLEVIGYFNEFPKKLLKIRFNQFLPMHPVPPPQNHKT